LDAIDKDTPKIFGFQSAPLVYMARRCIAPFSRIGRRKNLVPFATDRLKCLATAERGMGRNEVAKIFETECGHGYLPLRIN
jgi:hypothetical protein